MDGYNGSESKIIFKITILEEIKDFETFYSIKIEPNLSDLKKENKVADKLGILMIVAGLLAGGFFIASITKAIGEIVTYLNPGIVYKPEAYVSSKEYKRSCLYRKSYDYYEGDDLLQGKYKGVSFYCSEVHTFYTSTRGRTRTVFKGLFFVAGINQSFKAGTYVWPRDEDQFA